MRKFWSVIQHSFEYLLILIMTIGGVQTILYSTTPIIAVTAIGAVIGSPWVIITFGLVFTASGVMLLLSKILRCNRAHQWALMTIFVFNLFGTVFEMLVTGIPHLGWLDNLVYAIIAGIIHIRRDKESPPPIRSKRWLRRRIDREII